MLFRSVLSISQDQSAAPGIYHLSNQGYTTWYDYADYFLKLLNKSCTLTPVDSSAFPRPAKRPQNGRLDISKLLNLNLKQPRKWQDAVTDFLS